MKLPNDSLVAVLSSLYELITSAEGRQLTRRHLTHYLYFLDLFRPSYGMWHSGFVYERSQTGLRSYQIDAVLAFLIANGALRAFRAENDAELNLTEMGVWLVREVESNLAGAPILELIQAVNRALAGISATSLTSLCQAVYSEDSFRDAQIAHVEESTELPSVGTPYHPAVQAQAVIEKFLRKDSESLSPRSDILIGHLQYLATLAESRQSSE